MSQKRKNRLVPIMMDLIVGGQPYIEMVVCMDGNMFLSHHTFLGQPYKRPESCEYNKGTWKIKATNKRHQKEKYATDLGVAPGAQYNSHRVFRHTGRNLIALQDLVRRQALREYLELIGEDNIDQRIEDMRGHVPYVPSLESLDDLESFDDEGQDLARDLDGEWVDADSL